MPLLTISCDAYQRGLELSRQVAEKLDYKFLDRGLLDQVAERHGVARDELVKALDEPPGLFGMRSRRRQLLLCHLEAACLEQLQTDDTVCYGVAAHLFLKDVSHAMAVRVLEDPKVRCQDLAQHRGVPLEKARTLAQSLDQNHRRWSLEYFTQDETDPAIYDMVLSLSTLDQAKAVDIIVDAAGFPKFQAMTYSKKLLADKALAARVREKLLPHFPEIRVCAADGTIVARLKTLKRDQRKKQEAVRNLASGIAGVNYVEVHVNHDFFNQAASAGR
ncbi:MAG: cytidylate kinase-like family protein [Deltaproteobacteria bacterium]|nr:cytidylate kinase-like family protein [Deltaproteobacteria bacterium]